MRLKKCVKTLFFFKDVKNTRLPSLSIAASLPVTISRGLCTPNEYLISGGDTKKDDNEEPENSELDKKSKIRPRAKTVFK